jgi:hypothetical protein
MPEEETSSTVTTDYHYILKTIKGKRCALFLGPDACLSSDGVTTFSELTAQLIQSKVDRQNGPVVAWYADEGLAFFKDHVARTDTCDEIKSLYSVPDLNAKPYYADFYQKIVRIPFHLYLSVSPDPFLQLEFSTHNLPHQFGWFAHHQPITEVQQPTPEQPLIYNLVGSVEDAESLVLTHEDLFEYLASILGEKKLPAKLKAALLDANLQHLIFLGFPLQKWSSQLLIRLVRRGENKSDKKDFRTIANHAETLRPDIRTFCIDQFNITFIQENFLQFVDQLYEAALDFEQNPQNKFKLRQVAPTDAAEGRGEVFLSHVRGSTTDAVADRLRTELNAKGFRTVPEKSVLDYKTDLRRFIQQLGAGKRVVLLLDESFLQDQQCMQSILEIRKYPGMETRIYPILMPGADLADPVRQLDFVEYWDKKKDTLSERLTRVSNQADLIPLQNQVNLFAEIRRFLADFMDIIQQMRMIQFNGQNWEDLHELTALLEQQAAADHE